MRHLRLPVHLAPFHLIVWLAGCGCHEEPDANDLDTRSSHPDSGAAADRLLEHMAPAEHIARRHARFVRLVESAQWEQAWGELSPATRAASARALERLEQCIAEGFHERFGFRSDDLTAKRHAAALASIASLATEAPHHPLVDPAFFTRLATSRVEPRENEWFAIVARDGRELGRWAKHVDGWNVDLVAFEVSTPEIALADLQAAIREERWGALFDLCATSVHAGFAFLIENELARGDALLRSLQMDRAAFLSLEPRRRFTAFYEHLHRSATEPSAADLMKISTHAIVRGEYTRHDMHLTIRNAEGEEQTTAWVREDGRWRFAGH